MAPWLSEFYLSREACWRGPTPHRFQVCSPSSQDFPNTPTAPILFFMAQLPWEQRDPPPPPPGLCSWQLCRPGLWSGGGPRRR